MNHSPLPLKLVGIVVGLLLVATHALAFYRADAVREWLVRLPRSREVGLVVLTVDFIWTWLLAYRMDWGEFYYVQTPVLVGLPVVYYLVIRYVDEFLSARALGILGLLAAAPLLDAAFLRPPESRLLVVVLAYAWIILGMFWVGQPHLLRDQVGWLLRSAARWRLAVGAGLAYGAVMIVCALAFY